MPIPERLQLAAQRYVSGDDEDDLALALDVIGGFGISKLDVTAKRRIAMLCVLVTRRVLPGWAELMCEGEGPAIAIQAAWNWIHTGELPADWHHHCVPAPAIFNGHPIADCDACRVEPIAAAAARTVYFIMTENPVDAALVLCDALGAALEGGEARDSLSFKEWVATNAILAAFELRDPSAAELDR